MSLIDRFLDWCCQRERPRLGVKQERLREAAHEVRNSATVATAAIIRSDVLRDLVNEMHYRRERRDGYS